MQKPSVDPLTLNIETVVAEMRTSLAEINFLASGGRLKEVGEVARHTLQLFETFLYAQRLETSIRTLESGQYSLSSLTDKVLNNLRPLAGIYDIKLRFKEVPRKETRVRLVKDLFEKATHSLLLGLISSLQNEQSSILEITVRDKPQPALRLFSPSLRLRREHLSFPEKTLRYNPVSSGAGYSLPLAKFLYTAGQSPVKFLANQYGTGLRIDFQITQQIPLKEIIC